MLPNLDKIKLMAFDVDGVLTDGGLHYGPHGEVVKVFHSQDGLGMKMLQDAGIALAIITARNSPMVQKRAEDLKIKHLHQGIHDKRICLQNMMQKLGLHEENVGYVGDDIIDLPAMSLCGLRVAVANAMPAVKAECNYITERSGGQGAVREICDMLLSKISCQSDT